MPRSYDYLPGPVGKGSTEGPAVHDCVLGSNRALFGQMEFESTVLDRKHSMYDDVPSLPGYT